MVNIQRQSKLWRSTASFDGGGETLEGDESDNDLVTEKAYSQLQGVDPGKGWGFRGVHKVFDVGCDEKVYWCCNVL